jgi:hypothetical protein
MNNAKANVITAMKICGMEAISEGGMYHALFSQGLDAEEATMIVKELLEEGRISRSGCAFLLRRYVRDHGEESSSLERSVCNS